MEREFNLIDEPWICVRTSNCKVCEVSLMDIFRDAHKYEDFAGELKTQDIAILRLLLAVVHTVFSRYDYDGNEISGMSNDQAVENWERLWNNGSFPIKPFERYFEKWHDRFWLFDDNYPFYQVNRVDKLWSGFEISKLIGSVSKSGNKNRLFNECIGKGYDISNSEVARWLVNIYNFDDKAARNTKENIFAEKTWVGRLGLIAITGNSLFETIMLNYVANANKCNVKNYPVWEKDIEEAKICSEIIIPDNQAELLTIHSRNILLCKENDRVKKFYLVGGDYFSGENSFEEQMTVWKIVDKRKLIFMPMKHESEKALWREFGSMMKCEEIVDDAENGIHVPGIIKWVMFLKEEEIIDEDYMVNLCTATVQYNKKYGQPIEDVFSDSLTFHSGLLLKVGAVFRSRINDEIEKCDKAAKAVGILSIDLQKANGATEGKSGPKLSGDEAKRQFYERIDKPFRLWLRELNPNKYMEINSYIAKLEVQLKKAALDVADNLLDSMNISSVIGKMVKKDNKTEIYSASKKLNEFNGIISNIFDKAVQLRKVNSPEEKFTKSSQLR